MIVPEFTAPNYQDRTLEDVQRCRNLIPEKTKSGWVLVNAPGLLLQGTTANNTACKAAFYSTGASPIIYSAHGSIIYRTDSGGTITSVGTFAAVNFAENSTQVLAVSLNSGGAVITKATHALVAIADVNFPSQPVGAAYLDGWFITGSRASGTFYISALADGSDWTPITFATAESRADTLVDVRVMNGQLYLIGTGSIEIWYTTGNPSFPFERINGAALSGGAVADFPIAQCDDSLFYIGENGTVWMIDASGRRKISTPYIESRIAPWLVDSDLRAFAYKFNGHHFYQVTNSQAASGEATWVYDVITDAWHERITSTLSAHRLQTVLNAFPNLSSGTPAPWGFDALNGKIYKLIWGEDEDGTAITHSKDFGPIGDGTTLLFHRRIEFFLEAQTISGTSTITSVSATLSWSDDGGKTFTTSQTLSQTISGSATGQLIRLYLNRLGSSRKRIYRLSLSGPQARLLFKHCDLDAGAGRH